MQLICLVNSGSKKELRGLITWDKVPTQFQKAEPRLLSVLTLGSIIAMDSSRLGFIPFLGFLKLHIATFFSS